MLAVTVLVTAGQAKGADKYWRTDGVTTGTWTNSYLGNIIRRTFQCGMDGRRQCHFQCRRPPTSYVTATVVGNVTVNANTTVTAAGTLTTAGTISTFTVADGVTLTWTNQTFAATAGTGFIKAGNGTWDMSSEGGAYPGGFTLNAGTMIVSKKNSFGAGTLNLNGGTIQSSGSSAFAPNQLNIGGDFTFTGTGNDTWAIATSLGAATRNITNNTTSGSRMLIGVISGNPEWGLTFGAAVAAL